MAGPFASPDAASPGGAPDYTQQSTFDNLQQQGETAAPQTYNDPAWNPPQAEDQIQPAPEEGQEADYGPVAAGGGGPLPRSAQAVVRRMTEAGYQPEHIAGVLGALDRESSLNPSAYVANDAGTGPSFGIAQWHASRMTALMQFARNRNIDPYDADTQAQYLVHELNSSAWRAGQDLMAQKGFAGAARVWRVEFERSAGNYDDAAIASASRMLPSVQQYAAALRSGDADQSAVQDGTINGTADGTGGARGDGTTLDPVSRMAGLMGGNSTTAAPFIRQGGGTLDPRKDNWCAAFTNAALAQAGIRGSNSNIATSFMGWGTGVDANDVARNDVVCIPRGHAQGELGGHVGLATGGLRDNGGVPEVEVISGNTQHGHVAVEWYPANEVLIRRSATADTGAMDPQGAGPDVAPSIRRTGNAQYSINGMTLPDLDHGGVLPHGEGAAMDPSDAANFRQSYAPNGLTEMARQFGGSFSDFAWGMGRDLYNGSGPLGNLANQGVDWIGSKLGTDLSWLHSRGAVGGGLLPGEVQKGVTATIDQAHEALDRVMGYDPDAPTGFLGSAGRYAGLVATMLAGGVGEAAANGGVRAALPAAAKAAERAGIGGMSLAEGQHLVEDATGSPQAGEASMAAVAAALGLRAPVLERALPSISGIVKGATQYARGLVGQGIDDATALNALTPSQLHDAFANGLRNDFNTRYQRAAGELANLGNPTSFQGATGDVNANLTRGSDLLAEAIRRSVDNARTVERGLWGNVDKTVMRDYSGANNVYDNELANFKSDQEAFNRPPADFPSDFLRSIFKDSSPQKMESTGVLGPDGNPIMRPVSAQTTKGLGQINNLGSGQEARSQIEERIRQLQNNPDTPGARSQIGVLQRISHALLDDMSDMTNGAGTGVDAFNRARAFSRALADVRSQPDIASVLDKGIANGQRAIDPAIAAGNFLSSGPRAVAGLRQLQAMAQINGGDAANIQNLFQDFVRQSFVKAAAPDGDHVSLVNANRFMQRYGQLLDQMPDVRTQLQGVINGEQSVSQALGKGLRGWTVDPAGTEARSQAAANWLDNPVDHILDSFDGRSPREQALMFRNVLQQTMRDKTGAAFEGYRNALVDKILGGADQAGSQAAIRAWAEGNQGIIKAMSAGPDPTFADRIEALSNVNNKVGARTAITDLAQRLLGTHLGGMVDRATGGEGFGGSLSMASWGTKTVRQAWASLPFANRLDVARELLRNPKAFDAFAKTAGVDLKGQAQSLAQQFTAANLLSSYLQGGATPAAFALQHALNDYRRKNGDPNAPSPGMVGFSPGPPAPVPVASATAGQVQ